MLQGSIYGLLLGLLLTLYQKPEGKRAEGMIEGVEGGESEGYGV
jgi:hypothetical protein